MDRGQQLFYQGQSGESVHRGRAVSIDPQCAGREGGRHWGDRVISEVGVYWGEGRGGSFSIG